ncbi:MAG: response regulator transcription factor [Mariniphaga sp.]
MDKMKKVIIADSQFLVVEALKSLIEADRSYMLTGISATQSDLLKLLEKSSADLLITDFANIDYDGLEDFKKFKLEYPQLTILILTNTISKQEFSDLNRVGIKNIIYKTADKDEIFSAIESTLKSRKFYSDEILDMFLDLSDNKGISEDPKTLTPSEIEIVKLIAGGLTTKEIASRRNISYHTVNTHRKNIFRKVEVSNASELIMLAIKAGWIDNIEYYI